MAIVLTKIKRKLREGDFRFSLHCLEELFSDSFTEEDAGRGYQLRDGI